MSTQSLVATSFAATTPYARGTLQCRLHDRLLSSCTYAQLVVRGEEELGFGDHAGIYRRKYHRYVYRPWNPARYTRLRFDFTRLRCSFDVIDWLTNTGCLR